MSGEDFIKENQGEHRSSKSKKELLPLNIEAEKLRIKFKWMKDQWRKYTDRIKKGSSKSPIQEPEWYTIIYPVFSDTNGDLKIASKAMHVLSDNSDSEVSNNEDTESVDIIDIDEGQDADESDLTKTSDSGNDCDKQTKAGKKELEAKPLTRKKRIRTQSQAINEIAKSFNTMGESQERRSEIMMQAEKERCTYLVVLMLQFTQWNPLN